MKNKITGIILCACIASIATMLSGLHISNFSLEIIGAPVLSIIMGMLITMCRPTLAENSRLKNGIKFTSKKILQWAVINLGFKNVFDHISTGGGASLELLEGKKLPGVEIINENYSCLNKYNLSINIYFKNNIYMQSTRYVSTDKL